MFTLGRLQAHLCIVVAGGLIIYLKLSRPERDGLRGRCGADRRGVGQDSRVSYISCYEGLRMPRSMVRSDM